MSLRVWRRPSCRRLLALTFALCATAGTAQGPGRIVGALVDEQTGEPLIGAFVIVRHADGTQTPFGAAADLEGAYRIVGVPPGTYVLEGSMIGYNRTAITQVVVQAGAATQLDFALASEAIQVEEVVVEAKAIRNTEAALLKQRQRASAVSDAISAEDISRAGASDAADAMTHVTGASVQDSRYVYIRGLGNRYSTVQPNGAELPCADPERRAVPMDMFPASLLESIVTVKSFTPDKPGNFTGGAVDIGTRSMPEQLHVSLSAATAYNPGTSLGHVLGYEGGKRDWLGVDDGTRSVPATVSGPAAIPDYAAAFSDAEKAHQLDLASKSFSDVMGPRRTKAPLDQSTSFAVGNQMSVGGRPLGVLASATFSRKQANYDDGSAARWQLTGATDITDALVNNFQLGDARSSEEASWGGLFGAAYRPHDRHELGATLLYNHSGEDVSRFLVGQFRETLPESDIYETRVLHFTERQLQSLQVTGKHQLPPLADLRVEWSAATSRSTQSEPDLRYFSDNYTVRAAGDTLFSIKPASYPDPTRYFRDLDETSREAKVDLVLPLAQWGGLGGQVKAGGLAQDKGRSFAESRFKYVRPSSFRYTGDLDSFFADASVGIVDSTGALPRFGNYVVDATERSNSYDGDQQVHAGYGMVELPLHERLRLIAGGRFESTRIDVVSANPLRAPGHLATDDLLPSLNLVYQVGEANLRASWGRTLARPTFRELAPFSSFAFVGDFTLTGNPALDRTLIDNCDLRWEWFPRPGEIYAVSAFWKAFHSPIERVLLTDNGEVQYQNVDAARVAGLELEGRKNLAFLGSGMRNVFAGGNLALVHSRVDVPRTELAVLRVFDPDAASSRALQGQSPYVLNLDLSYDDFASATAAGLSYNLFGRRLHEVSLGGTPNVFEEPRGTLDGTVTKGIGALYSVKLAAKNLLDAASRYVYPYKGTDFVAQEYRSGRSYSLGLTYRLGG